MSYEINLIAVGQERARIAFPPSSILIRNERTCEEVKRYFKIWPVIMHIQGILYSLEVEVENGFYSGFPICDSDFEHPVSKKLLPAEVPDKYKEYLTPLLIHRKYYDDFIKAIEWLLGESPVKTIVFQTRYEGGDYEVVMGTLSLTSFLQKLEQGGILFNTAYIISDEF